MKITMVGTGYVGLVTGTCLAESGNEVVCVDKDERKVATLDAGGLTIVYERAGDVRDHNRRMETLLALLDQLAASTQGRLALEALLQNAPTLSLRVMVANVVMRRGHGLYGLTDPFVQEIWRERKALMLPPGEGG